MKLTVNGKIIEAERGELLSDVLEKNGFPHPRPCGGKGVCGKCAVLVNGEKQLSCKYRLEHEASVVLAVEGEIFSESGVKPQAEGEIGSELALDIGTTTLALAVLSEKGKRVLRVLTANNPQRKFGADVVSRMEYAQKNGVSAMTQAIREEISKEIAALLAERGGTEPFETLHVAGNATMLHLLLGEDPSSMGVAPYTPVFLDEKRLNAADYGIFGVKNLHLLPSISAFVGADLVAGLNLTGLPQKNYSLLVDLGTNAEVLLYSKDEILATAAAAGPCFEGANISCGMTATSGALASYGEAGYTTVENAPPVGICGTGLVDVVATLLRRGIIDETGYMEENEQIFPGVTLTQGDVRQYQLAKSAVYSAIVTLVKRAGITFSEVEALYVAGGFAAKLNVENAVLSGLIPRELKEKFVYLGNSSLLGTVKAAQEGSDLARFTDRAEYVDLSKDAVFSELFISNMLFGDV